MSCYSTRSRNTSRNSICCPWRGSCCNSLICSTCSAYNINCGSPRTIILNCCISRRSSCIKCKYLSYTKISGWCGRKCNCLNCKIQFRQINFFYIAFTIPIRNICKFIGGAIDCINKFLTSYCICHWLSLMCLSKDFHECSFCPLNLINCFFLFGFF